MLGVRCEVRRLRCGPRSEVCGRRCEVRGIVDSFVMEVGGQGSPLKEGWGSQELGISLEEARGSHWEPRAPVFETTRHFNNLVPSGCTLLHVSVQGDVQLTFGCASW